MSKTFDKKLGIRLKKAREKLGLTLEDVSGKMRFKNYQTLSSIEKGERAVKAIELERLAKIYIRDISYFIEEKPREAEELVLWRCSLFNQDTKVKEQKFIKYYYDYVDIEDRLKMKHRNILQLSKSFTVDDFDNSYKGAGALANTCYRLMDLGSRPACSLEKVLEENYNIKIIYLDLGDCGSAASTVTDYGAAILLNSAETPWRRNYNLAHELFHIVTWNIFPSQKKQHTDSNNIVEKWANVFASQLLLPREEVENEFNKRVVDKKISIVDLITIAKDFVVSTEALLWRLVNLNLLIKEDVKELIDSKTVLDVDREERVNMDKKEAPHISNRYISLIYQAYTKNLISKGKAAEYLRINRRELSNLFLKHGYSMRDIYEEKIGIA